MWISLLLYLLLLFQETKTIAKKTNKQFKLGKIIENEQMRYLFQALLFYLLNKKVNAYI